MNKNTKLFLDIAIGAVIPILILNYLTRPLGAPTAYVVAALVPVGWVFIDLLALTRKFNFITSYIGLSAIVNGALAFWFVDGLLYAIKDNIGLLLTAIIFGGSIFLSRPIFKYFFSQAVNPDTPQKEAALEELFQEPPIRRALINGTVIVAAQNLLAIAINFYLNIQIVTGQFGTEAFNQQVARVNGITRLLLPIPSFIAFGIAGWLIYRTIYRQLPSEGDTPKIESDFWKLVAMRDKHLAGGALAAASDAE